MTTQESTQATFTVPEDVLWYITMERVARSVGNEKRVEAAPLTQLWLTKQSFHDNLALFAAYARDRLDIHNKHVQEHNERVQEREDRLSRIELPNALQPYLDVSVPEDLYPRGGNSHHLNPPVANAKRTSRVHVFGISREHDDLSIEDRLKVNTIQFGFRDVDISYCNRIEDLWESFFDTTAYLDGLATLPQAIIAQDWMRAYEDDMSMATMWFNQGVHELADDLGKQFDVPVFHNRAQKEQ